MTSAALGFIGAGNMGGPMTTRLLNAGHKVVVFDTSAEALATVEKVGAQIAGSAAEVARAKARRAPGVGPAPDALQQPASSGSGQRATGCSPSVASSGHMNPCA